MGMVNELEEDCVYCVVAVGELIMMNCVCLQGRNEKSSVTSCELASTRIGIA